MGLFSGIKKLVKKALKFTGIPSLVKGAKGIWNGLTGKTAALDMAKSQEAQMQQQSEAAKLRAANEVDNVTQFEDGSTNLADETRRKKHATGSFGSGIGLVV